MIEAGRAAALRGRLRVLEELAPFAPRAVAAELGRMAADPRYVFPERRAFRALLQTIERDGSPGDPACCAFPVVSQRQSFLEGAVLHGVVTSDRRPGAAAVEEVFAEERRMLDLLARFSDSRASVIPSPLHASTPVCELVGDSGGAAFALALEASRRGVSIPRDVAVSAALGVDGEGKLKLVPVSGCDRKRRVLEKERPGCRFFFVPQDGETVGPSSKIELVPLPSGSFEELCERILPSSSAAEERWAREAQEAEALFDGQDYLPSKRAWRRLYLELRSERRRAAAERATELQRSHWSLQALSRLGAIELHLGQPFRASLHFQAARSWMKELPELPAALVDEVLISVASVHLDRMEPGKAEAILSPLTQRWRELLAADPEGLERRMMLIACLGATRRLMLLKGEANQAVEVQQELLRWAPSAEEPRSLADLGECLRRAGEFGKAQETLALGRASLYLIPIESYRIQTEAFIAFYEGRLALDQGTDAPAPLYLENLRRALPSRSAAGWRLEQLGRLLRLRSGDRDAALELIDQLDLAKSDFAKWHAVLGLLRGARLTSSAGPLLRRAAADALDSLGACTAGYPALEAARLEFVSSVRAERDSEWAERLHLRLAAY